MDCKSTSVPSIGSFNFIFFLLIPTCLALIPTNQTSPHPLNELNNTNTGDLMLPSIFSNATPSVDPDPSAPSPFGRHDLSTSTRSTNPSMAIIIAVLLGAFFTMGIISVYIRSCAIDNATTHRNPYNVNHHNSSNGRFSHTDLLSFPFMARQQLRSEYSNRPLCGLDLLLVSSLPTLKFVKGKGLKESEAAEVKKTLAECVVCLNEFEDGEELRFLPKCGHFFHQDCIDMWLFSHTTCPLCRRSLLYDLQDKGEEFHNSGGHNHARPTMDHEPIAAIAPVMNGDVHEAPLSAVAPLGYLATFKGPHGVLPLNHHNVSALRPNTMRRSHSTGHYLGGHLPPYIASFHSVELHCRSQPDTSQKTGRESGCASWSQHPPHIQLGCTTWSGSSATSSQPMDCATGIQPMPATQLGGAGWNPPIPLDRLATWNRPTPTESNPATRNCGTPGNELRHATWSQAYHRAHSCNVLLDLQAMRRALQGASPSSGHINQAYSSCNIWT